MKFNRKIITYSPEACFTVIEMVGKDDKTTYMEESFSITDGYITTHHVTTDHNILNFKRKYHPYETR